MRVLPDLPDLHILRTDSLRPHEHHDDKRAAPIAEALRRDGVLRNPPVVLRLGGAAERYVVLDGANRTSAFRQLGLEHVLAQVVHPGDNQVEVETWNHVLLGVGEDEILALLAGAGEGDLRLGEPQGVSAGPSHGSDLASLSLRGGGRVTIASRVPDLEARVTGLNRLVQAYQSRAHVERTNAGVLDDVVAAFPSATALMVFLGFHVQDIVRPCRRISLLPEAGRASSCRRALRHHTLEALAASGSRQAKEQALAQWVKDKVSQRKVRYYAEATYLFDE
jgi:hypothetical protein